MANMGPDPQYIKSYFMHNIWVANLKGDKNVLLKDASWKRLKRKLSE
jgi:hypothetical protein